MMEMDFEFSINKPDAPVLVIGASAVDILGRLRSEVQPGTSNAARIRTSNGGTARNIAENLARLGQDVTLLTAVGEDLPGENLITHIGNAGVNIDYVLEVPNYPTGSYIGLVNSRGRLLFAVDDMRIASALTPAYLEENAELFGGSSLLFLDANLSKETLRKAFTLARKAKLPVCADPTTSSLAHRLKPYISRLRFIVPNEVEAAILCDCTPDPGNSQQALDLAKSLVSQGTGLAVITMAEFGVSYATSETSGQFPAIHTEILDPTGAGDALSAAIIFALLNEITLDDAIRLGVSAATLTLRYQGAVVPELSLEKLYDTLIF